MAPPVDGRPESGEVLVRRTSPRDHGAIVELAAEALGWPAGEPHDELFRWKHLDNPFGASAMWVAEADGELIAFRAMMRWRFRHEGRTVPAVRAVDTATRPDHQGRGLFRRLTSLAIDELRDEGVAFVFNTPNAQSWPGYLSMGWQTLGRVPVGVRVRSIAALPRLIGARVPADKWSLPTTAGEPAAAILDDVDGLRSLLASSHVGAGLVTDRDVEYLRWRYTAGPVRYRALPARRGLEHGLALFRVRRRGSATEATITDVLTPGLDRRARRELIRRIVRATGADYAITTQDEVLGGAQVRVPGQGPLLTWRALQRSEAPAGWTPSMGDIELF